MRAKILSLIAAGFWAASASAQSTTGTISGRVVDAQGLAVPGVTVTAASRNLQGVVTTVTSENGDYILTLLPSGPYTVTFDLTGFQRLQRTVNLAPTQTIPLEVTLGLAALIETVQVFSARSADVLTETALVATNFSQELIATLPTNRNIDATLLLAPAVHPTGPSGNYSISGSVSFENLFLINGVTVNENARGQAYDLYIEDAIQETTVATAGVSAEFGRFGGGVVNMITKSGGNVFSGSFRDTLHNDDWRTLTPFEERTIATGGTDPRIDKSVSTYEYTLGGPIVRDVLWFFTAGRLLDQAQGRQLVISNLPYTFTEEERRYEFKGTYALTSNHRFQSGFTRRDRHQFNNTFNTSLSMDTRSLEDRQLPEDIFTVNYTGVLTSSFFFEGRYSNRHQSFIGSGAKSTDLIDGTLLIDRSRGSTRYWAATFCGVCTPEQRDNEDVFVKGTYFLSTGGVGSHSMVFGYDRFNDERLSNNHQSGSDYRILGTGAIIQGSGASQVIFPQFLGDGTTIIQWNPIPLKSEGANFRTHSLFYNDAWRVSDRLTANLGVRWDKNDGADQGGRVVARDSAISPRIGVIWDPRGDQRWSVTASFAKYVAAISSTVANSTSSAGSPQTFQFVYRGPNVNPAGTANPASPPDAIRALFDWFFANGGPNLPLNGAPSIPGVTPQIRDSLGSPHTLEYAGGAARQFGSRAAIRLDGVYRDYRDFYVERTNLSTGRVPDSLGRPFDLTLVENDDGTLKRRYTGLTLQGTYRLGSMIDLGGNYTLSRAWGNYEGENVASGPVPFGGLNNPEYKRESWNYPEGDLGIDQRHRSRWWVIYRLPWLEGLTVSLLQALESGVPYSASTGSGVDPRPWVTNPGYLTPPSGTQTTYFFGPRGEFRTEGQVRTDFAANYVHRIPGARSLQVFGQLQVINLFNQFQLCGCGASVFANGGAVNSQRIDQTILTAVNAAARFQPFNPFTTTPAQGVHWDKGPNFGTALNRFAYTSPRALRISFGVRF